LVGKLIKNEFKAGFHFLCPIYIVVAIISALAFYTCSNAAKDLNSEQAVLPVLVLMLAGLAVFAGTIITVIINFNKSMFKDQGYLTFTLPASSTQLLFAKAFSSFIWILFSYIVFIALLAGAVISMLIPVLKAEGLDSIEKLETFYDLQLISAAIDGRTLPWGSIYEAFDAFAEIGLFIAAYIFILSIFSVSQIYFSVSLSNVRPFQKLGMFSTIGIYFFVFVVTSIISSSLNESIAFCVEITLQGVETLSEPAIMEEEMSSFKVGIGDIGFPLLATSLFFPLTSWFMKHKINLK